MMSRSRGRGELTFADGRAAALDLEVLEAAEEIERREFHGIDHDFGDGIEEGRRAGRAIDGLGLDAGRLEDFVVVGQRAEEVDAGIEFLGAVAEVGAEGDADGDEHGIRTARARRMVNAKTMKNCARTT